MPARYEIILRLFAVTYDIRAAHDLAGLVASKAGHFGEIRMRPIERYWKIPDYYEVGIELLPEDEPIAAFEGILSDLATGWNRSGSPSYPCDLWAIWIPSSEGRAFSPLVTWMSLNLFLT